MTLNSRQRSTLDAIFAQPPAANIRWTAIESLLRAHGAKISRGRGSRVRIELNGEEAVFHRPHPQPDTDCGAVRSMRRFLEQAGVSPEAS